jgi:hypothetical protein
MVGKKFFFRTRHWCLVLGFVWFAVALLKVIDRYTSYGSIFGSIWYSISVICALFASIGYFICTNIYFVVIGPEGILIHSDFNKTKISWENVEKAGRIVLNNKIYFCLVLSQPVMSATEFQKRFLLVPKYFREKLVPLSKLTGKKCEADLIRTVELFYGPVSKDIIETAL